MPSHYNLQYLVSFIFSYFSKMRTNKQNDAKKQIFHNLVIIKSKVNIFASSRVLFRRLLLFCCFFCCLSPRIGHELNQINLYFYLVRSNRVRIKVTQINLQHAIDAVKQAKEASCKVKWIFYQCLFSFANENRISVYSCFLAKTENIQIFL